MFADAITPMLMQDSILAGLLSDVGGFPAVFEVSGPEDVDIGLRYLVSRITGAPVSSGDPVVSGDLNLDYFDYGLDRTTTDAVAARLEDLLDQILIDSDRLSDIRLSLIAAGEIPGGDTKAIHHNSHFSFRATRKQWISTNY